MQTGRGAAGRRYMDLRIKLDGYRHRGEARTTSHAILAPQKVLTGHRCCGGRKGANSRGAIAGFQDDLIPALKTVFRAPMNFVLKNQSN